MGRHYPPPLHDTIIEPFAGAAGYSIRWWDRDVILIDLDEHIIATWQLLIESTPGEIRALPLIDADTNIRELPISFGAQCLIGFWSGQGVPHPRVTPSRWPNEEDGSQNSGWTEATREHVAHVAGRVGHWEVIHGSYTDAPDIEATWFIDPPYQDKGRYYRHGSSGIDYGELGKWCKSRRGQVMACENEGADWLEFEPFMRQRSTWRPANGEQTSAEVVWFNMGNPWPQLELLEVTGE
ncbi:MAG: hypothetical protein ACLFVJ_16930 [Persicimonas sp.]